jgi:sugar lactone lactonase YvrE
VDGPAGQALLQHPLGVALLPDGSLAVCDTYNGAVRRYDPVDDTVSTLATGVAEPSGAVLVDGELVVVASAAHRLERPVAPGAMARVRRPAPRRRGRPTALAAGPSSSRWSSSRRPGSTSTSGRDRPPGWS